MNENPCARERSGAEGSRGWDGDDAALVAALRADNPSAKAILFQRHTRDVERVISCVLGFDAERADVVQETFVAVLTSLHGLRAAAALSPWLSSVAANTARRVVRQRWRQRWLRFFVDSADEQRNEPPAAGIDVEGRRALRAVCSILSRLPSPERIAFGLRFVDGLTLAEVAAACEVSVPTVKRRLARARQRLHANAKGVPELQRWLRGGTPPQS